MRYDGPPATSTPDFSLAAPRERAYMNSMETGFSIAVAVAVAATFVVLIVGVVAMLRQGKFNAEYSNKLMRMRVIFQFTAIMLILFAFLIGHK